MSEMSRTTFRSSILPDCSSRYSSSNDRSKWSSRVRFPRPVMIRMSRRPASTACSTTYWMAGLSTKGSISFGCALVAGRNRVPRPAAGMTAFLTFMGLLGWGKGSLSHQPGPSHPGSLRARHLVAAPPLRGVHRQVGGADQSVGGIPILRIGSDADRHGDTQRGLQCAALGTTVRRANLQGHTVSERFLRHRRPRALGDFDGAGLFGLGQNHHELLAAVPHDGVDIAAKRLLESSGHFDEYLVASLVPEVVVHSLESIDVHHEEGNRSAVAARALDLPGQADLQDAAVAGAGQ